MFGGHAPPFGWYCSASKSRTSAPRSRAICVTSPVAPGWFVESSPRSSATRKQRTAGFLFRVELRAQRRLKALHPAVLIGLADAADGLAQRRRSTEQARRFRE